MGEFFKGWRRKTGCATLAIVLIFIGDWLRSQSIGDAILINNRHKQPMAAFGNREIQKDRLTSKQIGAI